MSPEFRFSRKTKALIAAGAIMVTGALVDMGLRVQPRWEEIEGLAQSIAPSPTLEEKRNVQELRHVEQTAKQPLLPETYEYIKSVEERQQLFEEKVDDLTPDELRNEVRGVVAAAGLGTIVLFWSLGSVVEDVTRRNKTSATIFKCNVKVKGGCPLKVGYTINRGKCALEPYDPHSSPEFELWRRCGAMIEVPPHKGQFSDNDFEKLMERVTHRES